MNKDKGDGQLGVAPHKATFFDGQADRQTGMHPTCYASHSVCPNDFTALTL